MPAEKVHRNWTTEGFVWDGKSWVRKGWESQIERKSGPSYEHKATLIGAHEQRIPGDYRAVQPKRKSDQERRIEALELEFFLLHTTYS